MALTAQVAGIDLRDRARTVWIGLRKVTYEDTRRLSFENEPPPGRFGVICSFTRGMDDEELGRVKARLQDKAGALRCRVHNHYCCVILYGSDTKHSFDVLLSVCCSEFGDVVWKALDLDGAKAEVITRKPSSGSGL